MRIIVTGGAGYIGSHLVRVLVEAGHQPVVLDDLSEGHRESLPDSIRLVEGDFSDPACLDRALETAGGCDGVIHMAACCLVGESMVRPGRYWDNNVIRSLRLLENLAMRGCDRFVFSSTAAVYGDPVQGAERAIEETHPCAPTNVYGETKLAFEKALDWYARCAGMRAISLRYFNAAGAAPDGRIGEDHANETHLIPIVCAAALGRIPHVPILGRDYPTRDGTCLRDYIHVLDLAAAHVLALESLAAGEGTGRLRVYNLGAERATSVLEVIETAARISGRDVPCLDGPRRPGDPPTLLASSSRARTDLGWRPEHSDLETLIGTALAWHRDHPRGYGRAAAP